MPLRFSIVIALLTLPPGAVAQQPSGALDPSRLTLGTDTLAIYMIQGSDTVQTGMIVDMLAVDSSTDQPRLLRVYRSQDRMLGRRLDTIVDLIDGLRPVTYRSRSSEGFQSLEFSPRRVTGWMVLVNGDSVGVDVDVNDNAYDAASFDLIVRALDLHEGFRTTVSGFIATTRNVAPLSARVTGTETIGGRSCWVVKSEFAGLPVTFWVDMETRQLRQQVMQVRTNTQVLFARPRSGTRRTHTG